MDYPGKVITKTQVTPTQTSASGNWTLDDQAAAIKNNNWPVALVPNPISKSLRFNPADTAYLSRTFGTPTNNKKWTLSGWVKRADVSSGYNTLFGRFADGNNFIRIDFLSQNLRMYQYKSANDVLLASTAVFRDASAWYHIVVVYDSDNATASNRVLFYVNGTQITSFSSSTYPSSGSSSIWNVSGGATHQIGTLNGNGVGDAYAGVMTEVYMIDGQALTPSSFGMTNPQTGQWIPLKYSGTYGTNGFYLNFKDATSTTTLGYDYSGNANNWTTNNFSVTAGAGNDSLTDVPTPWFAYNTTGDVGGVIRGNYATLNPLKIYGANFTYSNGNLQVTDSSSSYVASIPTLTPPNSGKWYWEVTVLAQTTSSTIILGLATEANAYSTNAGTMASYGRYRSDGDISNLAGTTQTAGSSYTTSDVIGVALDVDSGTVRFYKNGVAQGATPSFSFTAGTVLVPYIVGDNTAGTKTLTVNFGQRPFNSTPPTGFRSLCTTNLPATAIGFGLTNQGDDYMNVALYTGNGTSQSITGVGFQPDFTWIKSRSGADNHNLFNSVVGLPNRLFSNLNIAENTTAGTVTSFNSDGFSVGSISDVNANGVTFAAWNWNAGGSNVTNTNGTRTSTVRANTTAGFSIVTWTANGSSPQTIGHGLGVAPSMIITFLRNLGGDNHYTYHVSLGATKNVRLDETAAAATQTGAWNDTAPTSTVFSTGNFAAFTTNGCSLVAYCFAAVPGYSDFGSYTGNGSADGPFVYTGFRPRWLLIKNSNRAVAWWIVDTVRNPSNVVGFILQPNVSTADVDSPVFDILSNGFKVRTTDQASNFSGETIIYAAFAEFPFQFANAR